MPADTHWCAGMLLYTKKHTLVFSYIVYVDMKQSQNRNYLICLMCCVKKTKRSVGLLLSVKSVWSVLYVALCATATQHGIMKPTRINMYANLWGLNMDKACPTVSILHTKTLY